MARKRPSRALCSGVALIALCTAAPAFAQAVDDVTQDIVVTARKSASDTSVQKAPFAVTAYSDIQLEALKFRGLSSLTVGMPNVQADEAASVPGTAVFSIRGLGIASTVPSIDPTVGVFVDGVYMGINSGILVDNFDLAGIEVLRGPQGVLFGRNVTGGAILIRTRAPTDKLEVRAHASIETGLRYRADASVSGPLAGGLSAKLAVLYDHDDGWFTNRFDNRSFGRNEQLIIRPALRLQSGPLDVTLRLEHGQSNGDGPADANSSAGGKFVINIDNPGYARTNWQQAFVDTELHVPFGNGRITNIIGWRRLNQSVSGDFDGLPIPTFNINFFTGQHQFSEEIRYAGTFGPVAVTTGGYYFNQHLLYLENRVLLGGASNSTGGGIGDFSTLGAFASADYSATSNFTLNLGLRYTRETKKAQVGTIAAGTGSNLATQTLVPNFTSEKTWDDFTPKIGFQWQPSNDTNFYGFWARGFRSGGYNFRVTNPNSPPGPTDPESMNSFELGLKQDFAGRAGRINIALFRNTIKNVQRDITTVGLNGVGPAQQTRNSGDVRIQGAEIEARYKLTPSLLISGNVGYTDGKYTKVIFDLSGDGVIDATDLGLSLTRLAPWSYGASAIYDLDLGAAGTVSARMSYNHRDRTFISDNNQVVLPKIEMIDASLTFTPRGSKVSISVYGTNLLNRVSYVSAVQFGDTAPFGGDNNPATPAPQLLALNRGRVIGAEVKVGF